MRRRIYVNSGDEYNSLTVIKEVEKVKSKRMILCKCICGNQSVVRLEYLCSGHTKSCGCDVVKKLVAHRKTHGKTNTRLHGIWGGMKARCYNKNRKSYKNYGALGITVCKEWKEFQPFYDWALENGYKEDLSIERLNPYGDYEPINCTWIPQSEQGKNKRSNTVYRHD